ncbi:MAG: AmmeMemoRadiSam system protein B, partial [Omnitrophica bacterium GWA2_52_8]
MLVRQPHVAGSFYPADPQELKAQLASLIHPGFRKEGFVRAVIVPHAGNIYSGKTAGAVWSAVGVPDRVLAIGPNHYGVGAKIAVLNDGLWRTPLGDLII